MLVKWANCCANAPMVKKSHQRAQLTNDEGPNSGQTERDRRVERWVNSAMHVARQASSSRVSDESLSDTQTFCTFGALDWCEFKGADEAMPFSTALDEVLRVSS